MLPLHLTNFEIQRYYQNEPRFNAVYLINNLLKIKDEEYVININNYKSIGTCWIAFYMNGDNMRYFDSFRVENIPKEIKRFKGNRNITTNIFRNKYFLSTRTRFSNVCLL